MIKRITTPEGFIPIFKLRDDVEDHIPYDRSSWIQWLVSNCANPNYGIFVELEGELDMDALSYVVAINAVAPPISRSVQIVYLYTTQAGNIQSLIDELKGWAKEMSASEIIMMTKDPEHSKEYGFKEKLQLVALEVL